jgi:hypothetical protein
MTVPRRRHLHRAAHGRQGYPEAACVIVVSLVVTFALLVVTFVVARTEGESLRIH